MIARFIFHDGSIAERPVELDREGFAWFVLNPPLGDIRIVEFEATEDEAILAGWAK